MTTDYVGTKVKEALKATNNDKQDAQRLLITWAVRDPQLLIGLTKPHLKAIVNSWIDNTQRAVKKNGGSSRDVRFSKEDIDKMIASSPKSGKRTHIAPPPKTSAKQASVMHQIAAAFKKRVK